MLHTHGVVFILPRLPQTICFLDHLPAVIPVALPTPTRVVARQAGLSSSSLHCTRDLASHSSRGHSRYCSALSPTLPRRHFTRLPTVFRPFERYAVQAIYFARTRLPHHGICLSAVAQHGQQGMGHTLIFVLGRDVAACCVCIFKARHGILS